jgi:hypothetical protein
MCARMYRVGGLLDLSTSGLLRYLVNHASASTPADLPTHVPRSHPPPLGGRVEEDGDDKDVEVEAMSVSAHEGFVRGSNDDDRRSRSHLVVDSPLQRTATSGSSSYASSAKGTCV